MITANKFVSISYQLRVQSHSGDVVEEVSSDRPLSWVFGTGKMLPLFEQHLEGSQRGDSFQFDLYPKDAYGERNPKAIVDIPKENFMTDGKLEHEMLSVGNVIPMQNQDGQTMQGRVVEVAEDTAKLDFNHPMAGEHLFFSGKVLEVRDATDADFESNCGSGSCEGCSC